MGHTTNKPCLSLLPPPVFDREGFHRAQVYAASATRTRLLAAAAVVVLVFPQLVLADARTRAKGKPAVRFVARSDVEGKLAPFVFPS